MNIDATTLASLRAGFSALMQQGQVQAAPSQRDRIATVVRASQKEQKYGWLKKLPDVREWIGSRVVHNVAEAGYSIEEKKWELTVGVDKDDIQTDNLGQYSILFQQMGESTQTKPERLVWDHLKAGFTTNCYDGQFFFDTDHPVLDADGNVISVANTDGGGGTPWFLIDTTRVVKPIIHQIRIDFGNLVSKDKDTDDNVFDLNELVYGVDARMNVGYAFWQLAWGSKQTLNADNLKTAFAAIEGMKGDYGRPLGLKPNLLVVPPSLRSAGQKLLNNELGANGETNEWKGAAELLVVPWLA